MTIPPKDLTHPKYRADIDGLRAIAVLSVVAFHAFPAKVPGGFIGVDIFFVISGFLIINQIKVGLLTGRFSVFSFYAQRALRILPSYLIVLLLTDALAHMQWKLEHEGPGWQSFTLSRWQAQTMFSSRHMAAQIPVLNAYESLR